MGLVLGLRLVGFGVGVGVRLVGWGGMAVVGWGRHWGWTWVSNLMRTRTSAVCGAGGAVANEDDIGPVGDNKGSRYVLHSSAPEQAD